MDAPDVSASSAPSRQGWKIALGGVISLVFLVLAFYNIDFRQLRDVFARVNPFWVLVVALLSLLSYFLRALLWKQLIGRRKQVRVWNLFRIVVIGYLANNILPLKLGEVIRAWLLGKKENLPTSLAIGTVVVERMMDLVALLLYFSLTMCFVRFASWLKWSGLLLVGVSLVLIGMVLVSYRYSEPIMAFLEKPLHRLHGRLGKWLHQQLDKFLQGLRLVQTPGQMAKALIWCLLTWFSWIAVTYATFLAFGQHLPLLSAMFLMVVLNFGLLIPSSPGGLGVYEFMVILALTPYGVTKETALGIGFTTHMIHYFLTIVLGWIFAVQMNLSMGVLYRHPENE